MKPTICKCCGKDMSDATRNKANPNMCQRCVGEASERQCQRIEDWNETEPRGALCWDGRVR